MYKSLESPYLKTFLYLVLKKLYVLFTLLFMSVLMHFDYYGRKQWFYECWRSQLFECAMTLDDFRWGITFWLAHFLVNYIDIVWRLFWRGYIQVTALFIIVFDDTSISSLIVEKPLASIKQIFPYQNFNVAHVNI